MSHEATLYVSDVFAFTSLILSPYLLYNYYVNQYKNKEKTQQQQQEQQQHPHRHILFILFCILTLFSMLISIFFCFLYNNAFGGTSTLFTRNYCILIINLNTFFYFFHSLIIYLIISYFIEGLLKIPNNCCNNYSFQNSYYIYYRIIIIIIHLFIPIYIIFMITTTHNHNINTKTLWKNSYNHQLIMCNLHLNNSEIGDIIFQIILGFLAWLITFIPLMFRYILLLRDHRNDAIYDDNEYYICKIKLVLFYLIFILLSNIILISIFLSHKLSSVLVFVLLLILSTTCIYIISIKTISYNMIYKLPYFIFNECILNKIRPLEDPDPEDPNYKWYDKGSQKIKQDKEKEKQLKKELKKKQNLNNPTKDIKSYESKTSVVKLSVADINTLMNEDVIINVDEEFNDDNSVFFSKIDNTSNGQIIAPSNQNIIDNQETKDMINNIDTIQEQSQSNISIINDNEK